MTPVNTTSQSEEDVLKLQLEEELRHLNINEDELEQKLSDCKKKIKAYLRAKKPPAEIEPYQLMETKLLRVMEIRNSIRVLRGEEAPSEEKPKPQGLSESIIKEDPMPMTVQSLSSPKFSSSTTSMLSVKLDESPTERLIEFSLGEGIPPKRIKYRPTTKCQDILEELQINNFARMDLQLREVGDQGFKSLALNQFVGELIPAYKDLEGRLLERYLVKGIEGEMLFVRGTSTDRIKKIMKGKGCVFFNKDHLEVDDEELTQDLVLLDCQEINVNFKGEVFKKKVVPMAIPVRDLPKFLLITGPDTLFVSAIKLNDKWTGVQQHRTLHEETKGAAIQEMRLSYLIDLSIEIITPQGNRPVNYRISSTQNIQDMKVEFEAECKFKAKLQKWTIHGKEIEGEVITFEEMGLDHTRYRVEVQEILNLEYYGFSQQFLIEADAFREFYVENDEVFVKEIN